VLWIVLPSKVDPSNAYPRTVAVTSVSEGCDDVSTKRGIPNEIGGRFFKHLE
jgi:hypothetical protein